MFKKTAIAAVAALTIAAAMASPAQALSKKGAFFLGLGSAAAIGIASAHAHGGYHGGYGHGGYHGGYGHGYRGGRVYRRTARRCARRFGWHTWRWERCMSRRGF